MTNFVGYLSSGKINRYLFRGHHHYVPFNRDIHMAFMVNFLSAALILLSTLLGLAAFIVALAIVTMSDWLIHRFLLGESRLKATSGLVVDIPILLLLIVETLYRILLFPFLKSNAQNDNQSTEQNFSSNWYGNSTCSPSQIFAPGSLEEVQKIIKQLANKNTKARVVGANLSYSPLTKTDAAIIETKDLKRILHITDDFVEVEAGIDFATLSEALAKSNLQLPAAPEIGDATIGGCLATATHGSNTKSGFFFDIVEEITLVLASGEVLTINKKQDKTVFSALQCSMGMLGFVYSVKLIVEPFHLTERQEKVIDEKLVASQWSDFIDNKNLTILWWPCLHKAIVVTLNPSSSAHPTHANRLYWLLRSVMGNQLLLLLSNVKSILINPVIRLMLSLFVSSKTMVKPHYQLATYVQAHRLFQNIESEWYFPQSAISKIIGVFGEHYRKVSENNNHYNFCCVYLRPIESKRDVPPLLFPTTTENWFGVMCWVGGHSSRNMKFLDDTTSMLYQLGGYPHNGKYDPWTKHSTPLPENRPKVTPQCLQTFIGVRESLDPTKMFSNSHIENILRG